MSDYSHDDSVSARLEDTMEDPFDNVDDVHEHLVDVAHQLAGLGPAAGSRADRLHRDLTRALERYESPEPAPPRRAGVLRGL